MHHCLWGWTPLAITVTFYLCCLWVSLRLSHFFCLFCDPVAQINLHPCFLSRQRAFLRLISYSAMILGPQANDVICDVTQLMSEKTASGSRWEHWPMIIRYTDM